MHVTKGEDLILRASCAKCKLLKVKILKTVTMKDMVDFLFYDICCLIILRGIITDRASNLIGSEVKERISSLNQGLNRFKFYKYLGECFEEDMEPDLNKDQR